MPRNEKYIEKISGGEAYNSCKGIINKKIYLKTIGIKEISELYRALKNLYSSTTGNSSYREILSSLSTDYNNFKSDCDGKCNCYNNIPTLPKIKAPPSLSIVSKLIPVSLIFAAMPIFLGIAYKYSLFEFDNRLQRQYLREKLKKIKMKMNHYM
ncbi:hypothetical protein YYG_02912 [Plasmodium vinckei petteri]|uniref:CIR protein PIR protein n=1 Tax=Plasmodium vinckei petteri TaxID=138298 RepID=W7B319_PLAVN|nr:hypothetical protein YYG_02912 [Plasmodium vinckei petteri]